MNALVAAARDLGKPVFVHAYGDEAVRRAALARVKSIEHGSLSSVATLEMLAEKGIYLGRRSSRLWPMPGKRRRAI